MLCKRGVQRAFFPIHGITHTVNNLNHITTALSDRRTAFRLTTHPVSILLDLQLNMLPGQRAIIVFFDHGLCLRTHPAAPFSYSFLGNSRHTCISTVFYSTTQTFSLTIRRLPHFNGQNARTVRAVGRGRRSSIIFRIFFSRSFS